MINYLYLIKLVIQYKMCLLYKYIHLYCCFKKYIRFVHNFILENLHIQLMKNEYKNKN